MTEPYKVCPVCEGTEGEVSTEEAPSGELTEVWLDCPACEGTGIAPDRSKRPEDNPAQAARGTGNGAKRQKGHP